MKTTSENSEEQSRSGINLQAKAWAFAKRRFETLSPLSSEPFPAHAGLVLRWVSLATILFSISFPAAKTQAAMTGTPGGRILTAGDARVMILSPAGEVLWQYPTKLTHDAWMLPNGNVLFADGETVTEVTPEKKVVFQYRAKEQRGGGAYACQRLPGGDTLVGENSTGRILEVNPEGRIVFALQTHPFKLGEHHNLRMTRKLANGNYLACHSGARLVKEYTPQGNVVWQAQAPGPLAFAAVRTPRGTTLVSSLDQVTEYDGEGKSVWQFSSGEAGAATVRNFTGLHLLPNGHLIIGCYRAYEQGKGCGLFELSQDKQLVWSYADPKADSTMMPVELLLPEGQAPPDKCLR